MYINVSMTMNNRCLYILCLLCCGLFSCSPKQEPEPPSDQQDTAAAVVPVRTPKSTKRGVAYSFRKASVDSYLMGNSISWFYNWGNTTSDEMLTLGDFYGFEYLPMAWNANYDANKIKLYIQSHPQCRYILAYNEPNLTDQARMTPRQAADEWPRLKALADELQVQLVAPAMNYGTLSGYGDPIKWLDEFFSYVPITDVCAIAVHCYMAYPSALKSYVERFYKYNLPIWMTEFCAWEAESKKPQNMQEQRDFCAEAVAYMEADPHVERYAWFIPRYNGYPYMALISNDDLLTEVGQVYCHSSAQHADIYYVAGQRIEAENYARCNVSDCIGKEGFSKPVHLAASGDADGVLDIIDVNKEQWVEYLIDAHADAQYQFKFRCASKHFTDVSVYEGETMMGFFNIDGDENETLKDYTCTITLPKGHHTLRFVTHGEAYRMNYFQFERI